MRCFLQLLNITFKDHLSNEKVRNKIMEATGKHDDFPSIVKKRKLRWCGHISSASGMTKTILAGTAKGTRRRGRQRKRWEDQLKDWSGLKFSKTVSVVEDRYECQDVTCATPTTLNVKGLKTKIKITT